MKPITSSSATGSFIPDSPSSERASRFSRVERRSTAKIAAESVAAIAAPTSIPSRVLRSKIHFAARPAIDGGDHRADRRQRGRGAEHRADLRPAGGQPALEEDQDQRDRAQRPGQLGVVELDPADSLRAGEHPEAEEEQQARDAHPVGEQRADDARGEQARRRSGSARRRVRPSADPRTRQTFSSIAASRASSSSAEPASGTSSAPFVRAAVDEVEQAEEDAGGEREADLDPAELVGDQRHEVPGDEEGGAAEPAGGGAPHLALRQAGLVEGHRGEVEAHPERDQQQAGAVVAELVAEGELHQLRPGDQDDERDEAR